MISQMVLNGIVAGSQYSLVALGFSLIYRTNRFLHFSHGAAFVLGAYLTYFLRVQCGMPLIAAGLLTVALCGMFGAVLEIAFYRRLRARRASAAVLFLTSLGVLIALQNSISLIWGDEMKSFRDGPIKEGIQVFSAILTPAQLLGIVVSTILGIAVLFFLYKTSVGREVRAVASNPALSRIYGINSDTIILAMLMLGSCLAGVAGIFKALDSDMTPTMGFSVLLMAVVAIVAGGLDSIPGAILGAYFVGFAQHLGVWFLPTQWQQAIIFCVLLLFLLLRPQGMLGTKARKATV